MRGHTLKAMAVALFALTLPAQAADRPDPHAAAMIAAMQDGQAAKAIEEADVVIAAYKARYNKADTLYFCGETPEENIANMFAATLAKKNAVAVSGDWCSAHFVKGYALIELGQPDRAEPELRRATEMAPNNAHYLNEYAELFKTRREWQRSYDLFAHAAEIAEIYPASGRAAVKARSLRGMGFTKIELGDLDEAERLFKRSLEVVPNHAGALTELRYIAQLRARTQ